MAFYTGGDAIDFLKYNAKAGRFYFKDQEIKDPVFIADIGNIKPGWFYLREGQAPEKVLDPSLNQHAPRPEMKYTDKEGKEKYCYQRGFEMNIFSNNLFGGVVQFGSTSNLVLKVISDLHSSFEAAPESKQGMLPVVVCSGVIEEKGQYGTNYKPNFSIQKWVSRPAEFDEGQSESAPAPQSAPIAAAPAVQNTGVSEF